jgi:hypothetical protein
MISLFVLDAARAELNRLNITKAKCFNFVVEYDEESDNSALTTDGTVYFRCRDVEHSTIFLILLDP